MFKYIGIRGHRGAGKNTISFLLGITIQYYKDHKKFDEAFNKVYDDALERIQSKDENFLQETNLNNVYFESFADSPKIMLSQLLGIPSEWMYDDWSKDNIFVNMKDFSIHQCKDKQEMYRWRTNSYNSIDLVTLRMNLKEKGINTFERATWISLRELIIYFGRYTMQEMFGNNVWVKSLIQSESERERFYADNKNIYKIFVDCKFSTEITYIKERGGKIIRVSRPDNIKENSNLSNELDDDKRVDFDIVIKNNLLELREELKRITLNIINND